MGRILGVLVVLGLTALIGWAIMKLVQKSNQRKLYAHNPELSDLPTTVVKQLTDNKQQLSAAERIMRAMLDDDINVFLPSHHKSRVQQWLSTNSKEIGQ